MRRAACVSLAVGCSLTAACSGSSTGNGNGGIDTTPSNFATSAPAHTTTAPQSTAPSQPASSFSCIGLPFSPCAGQISLKLTPNTTFIAYVTSTQSGLRSDGFWVGQDFTTLCGETGVRGATDNDGTPQIAMNVINASGDYELHIDLCPSNSPTGTINGRNTVKFYDGPNN